MPPGQDSLEARRQMLLSEHRQLEREKQAASDAAVNDPGFSPSSNTAADRRAQLLVEQHDRVSDELIEVNEQLGRDPGGRF